LISRARSTEAFSSSARDDRGQLDLHLRDLALEPVDVGGLALDLHLDAAGGLVDEVDRLVGQGPVADVAGGEHGRGHTRLVGDLDAVVGLVLLLDPPQDLRWCLDRRLLDQHRLEAPLERLVLLEVLAVLVEGGGADRPQLTAREGGLEHVAGVHAAFGLAGAHQRVELVDEQDDVAVRVLDLGEHALEALLELAAVLRAREQGGQVERQQLLALSDSGTSLLAMRSAIPSTIAVLPTPGLADEHGVVLGAAD
jgi:hypothetical protein